MEGITWEEYLRNIQEIFRISNELNDGWQLIEKVNPMACAGYLCLFIDV